MTTFTKISQPCSATMSCPGVWQSAESYVIVGKNVGVKEHPELEGRIGPDEVAIEIDRGIVDEALGVSPDGDRAEGKK